MATPISGCRIAALLAVVFFSTAALMEAVRAQVPAAPAVPPAAAPGAGAPAGVEPAAAAPELAGDAMQVLDQGPIHEAFAEPVALDAKPRVVVDRQPPEPINELPPDVRPEGANVQWISGYWMYSDEMQDFIWVSGVWRDVPPGRRWVPGHWAAEEGKFQWIGGFWADEQVQEVQMLPHPPATLEVGPSSPAPAANYFWVPGCWIYGNAGYSWRAGYWYAGQANWLWVPDHYCYTPRGSIFVSGYWDYGLPYRGMLFAPVWWSRPVWGSVGWYYRPRSIVNTSIILSALFIHGGHNHYYFGHGRWRNDFIRPWWDHGHRGGHHHRHYDPVFAYHRWHDGKNRSDWADNYKRDFDHRRREFDDRRGPGGRPGAGGGSRDQLIARAEDWARERGRSGGLRQVTDAERQATMKQLKTSADLREARIKAERTGGNVAVTGDRAPGGPGPNRGPGGSVDGKTAGPGRGRQPGADGETIARAGVNRGPDGVGGQSRSAFKLPPVERTTTRGAVAGGVGQTPQTQGSQRSVSRQDGQNRAAGRSATPGETRQAVPGGSVRRDFGVPGATTGPGSASPGSTPSPAQRTWSGSRGGEGAPSGRSIPSGSIERGPTRGGETPAARPGGSSSFRGVPSGTPSTRGSAPSPSFRGTPSTGAPSFRSSPSAGSPSSGSPSFRSSPSTGSPSFRAAPSGGSPSFRSAPSGGPPSSARSYSGSRGPSPSFQSRGGSAPSRSFSSGSGGGGRPSSSFSRGGGERGGGGGGGGGRGRR